MHYSKISSTALFGLVGISAALISPSVLAATPPPAQKQITTYAPFQALMTLGASAPRWHWAADGELRYMVRKDGKPQAFAFDPATGKLVPIHAKPPAPAHGGAGPRIVAPGIFSYSPPVREVPSPDGAWFAGMRGGNLYLRPAARDKHEVLLSHDGTPQNGYTVLGARWSPDGRYLALRRMDARGVPTIPLVDWSAADQPVKRALYSRVGDPLVRQTLVIADRRTGKLSAIKLDPSFTYLHPVSWSPDGRYLYLMATTRLMKRLDLIRVDAASGTAKTLLSERSKTNVDGSQSYLFVRGYAPELTALHYVTMLADGRFIWTSERDGWRRLYLYAADGTLIRALTPSGLVVNRVVAWDAAHKTVYYVSQARESEPYRNALFGAALAGSKPVQVAYGPAFFHILMRPDGRYFAFFQGGLHGAPHLDVYDHDGRHIRTLRSGDKAFARFRQGKVEPFVVTAADGKTPIHGIVFKPADFDAAKKYPVVEWIYAGPQAGIVPHVQADSDYWTGQALASSGFVAVEIDGRGTPGRGLAFANAFYGRIGQGEIADHVAALRQVAATRPWMDMHRVGVVGHSWGGYFAARALLEAPTLYKVAVASAGPATLLDFRAGMQMYMGCVPKQCPDAYAKGSNTVLVSHLQGKLMIMQGTADRDVPFGESMRLIAALEKAGKSYQYVAFPGQPHTIFESPYWWHRVVQFFKKTLGAAQPIHG